VVATRWFAFMNGRTPPTVFLLNGPAPVAELYSLQPCQISAGSIRDAAWCGFEVQGESLVPCIATLPDICSQVRMDGDLSLINGKIETGQKLGFLKGCSRADHRAVATIRDDTQPHQHECARGSGRLLNNGWQHS
jgi:hypothetical protein